MRRKFHSVIFLLLFSLAANSQVATSATDSILKNWLSSQTVNDDFPVKNTFYFWTTLGDLDSSLEQNQLLRTAVSSDYYERKYRSSLADHSDDNEAITNHLMGGERQRIRSAWPTYWMNMDWDTNRPQLVQVVLMDSSLIVSFFPDKKKKDRWRVHDLKGNVIPMDEALKRKRHIAAVFYSWEEKLIFHTIRRTVYHEHYRAFMLCNEDMIKSWHHAVPGLQAKVLQDFDYLVLLNAWFEKPENCAQQGKRGKLSYATWTMSPSRLSVAQMFFATMHESGELCINADQDGFLPIIDGMRYRFRNQKKPCERFPGRKK